MTDQLIDWEVASSTARRLSPGGPSATPAQAAAIVQDLRAAAREAHDPVAQTSRLHTQDPGAPVLVVDRGAWIDINAETMADLLRPAEEALAAQRDTSLSPAVTAVGSRITGAEAGALLAFLSGKVLGQYDLGPASQPRLLLVAPNIVHVERELEVDPRDFRRWVAMHEETHRVQFTAVPWLRQYLIDQTHALARELAPTPHELASRLASAVRSLPGAIRGGEGLATAVATVQQREHLAAMTAVMSLLEGHADVVMDEVGPQIIPTVMQIRARFDERRAGGSPIERLLRSVLGLEGKLRQYRDGAAFVRAVHEVVGIDGFNQVWQSPHTLPTPQEIAEPRLWISRVHR